MKVKARGNFSKMSKFDIIRLESMYTIDDFELYYTIMNSYKVEADIMDKIVFLRNTINEAKTEKEIDKVFYEFKESTNETYILYNMYKNKMRLLNKKNYGIPLCYCKEIWA